MERETRDSSLPAQPASPPEPYEPPAVAWEEAFDPVATSCNDYDPGGCPITP